MADQQASAQTPLVANGVAKSFTMHLRGGARISVVESVRFALQAGQTAVLGGPSGAGKSSILKMLYGNYGVDSGSVDIWHQGGVVDLARAAPRTVIAVRDQTIAYVSQFLRVVPRVSAVDVVAQPLVSGGAELEQAQDAARNLLQRLNLPTQLWDLPPATFSGGEQQRVNIARGFITDHPILLLDEPTASLDARNREVVIAMIEEKKAAGVATLGIFHDADVRDAVADQLIDVTSFAARPEAA